MSVDECPWHYKLPTEKRDDFFRRWDWLRRAIGGAEATEEMRRLWEHGRQRDPE